MLLCVGRLDIGDGKELDLEKCPRSKLREQCVNYPGPVSSYMDPIISLRVHLVHRVRNRLLKLEIVDFSRTS